MQGAQRPRGRGPRAVRDRAGAASVKNWREARHTCDVSRETSHVKPSPSLKTCNNCGRGAKALRKGQCPRCYIAAWRGITPGACCAACACHDPRVLVRRRMPTTEAATVREWETLCANCNVIAGKRSVTLAALRVEVLPAAFDRRKGGDRRHGERRGVEGDRRVDASREGTGDRRVSPGRRASDRAA